MTTLDKMIRRRGGFRRAFNKTGKEFDNLLSNEKATYVQIKAKLDSIKHQILKIQALDENILSALYDAGVEEDKIDAELAECMEYMEASNLRERSFEVTVDKKQNKETNKCERESTSEFKLESKYKHPKMKLKEFGGDLKEWIGWWSQFEKVHEDTSLQDVDKFQFLSQCMKEHSPAKRIVDAYPQSSENYQIEIQVLKERFGRPELLSELYVREF